MSTVSLIAFHTFTPERCRLRSTSHPLNHIKRGPGRKFLSNDLGHEVVIAQEESSNSSQDGKSFCTMETSQTSQSSQKLQAFCWRLALNRCLQPLLLSAAFQLHQWDGTKWWWSASGAAIQQEWCRSAPLVESWVMMDLIVVLRYTSAWGCIQTEMAKLCWNVSSLGYILSKAFPPLRVSLWNSKTTKIRCDSCLSDKMPQRHILEKQIPIPMQQNIFFKTSCSLSFI